MFGPSIPCPDGDETPRLLRKCTSTQRDSSPIAMMAPAMTAAVPLSRVVMFRYSEVANTLKSAGSPRM